MYQEHYYPNLDDAQREENRLHSGRNPFGIASLDLGFVLRDSLGSSRKGLAEYSIWVLRHLNLGSLTTRCMEVCESSLTRFVPLLPIR